MKESQPGEIRLKNYRIPCYLIDSTRLYFELGEAATLVKSNLQIRLNPDWPQDQPRPLTLDGVNLELKRLAIDGCELEDSEFEVDAEQLVIAKVPRCFELECVTVIRPQQNTSLEGLYKSSAMFCTQCEAEGFRKITYYLDRPDVMSVFTTVISADKARYPVLLSNGNDVDCGEMENGRHWVSWHDPFKKPAYLFALVAGDLVCIEDTFTTCSGREIDLRIYVEAENKDKCRHGMNSLQHSMRWDEEVYGREYDLDIFMIVAVNDFNMGAMENKGLNIFNSTCVLANPDTATDAAYQRIEGVVAHEYFHNWSGNRVTCRDWFQLSLKEGFTVFRDQEFSADMGSRTVKRIDDVSMLRTLQFAEDAGPMSHPIRPEAYMEISNFYTLTIYEKGAEVIRMLHRLLGAEAFRRGSDLYFERHDGAAVTTEDFVAAMADASGVDLNQFQRWYGQSGTPGLTVTDNYQDDERVYTLTVRQSRPDVVDGEFAEPLHIPLAMGLISPSGEELVDSILEITETEQSFVFADIDERPLPSLLRGFSAPVKLHYDYGRDDLMFLMQHDRDGFNRWDAGQQLAVMSIQDNILAYRSGRQFSLDKRLIEALGGVLASDAQDETLDQAMLARMLEMPSAAYLGEISEVIDVDAIHHAREFVCAEVARQLAPRLLECYQANQGELEYRPTAADIAQRSLKNGCLAYLMLLKDPETVAMCEAQYNSARNMTDRQAAFIALVHSEFADEKARVLEDFYLTWRHDPLVMNQWFAAQASSPLPGSFEEVRNLLGHADFSLKNPNKVRSLVGVFCNSNLVNFHREDGAGYEFLADRVLELDELNPQIAARQLTPLTRWSRYTEDRGKMMNAQLQRIQAKPKLSKDVFEVVTKSLG